VVEGIPALYRDRHVSKPVSVSVRNQVVFVEGVGLRRSAPLTTMRVGPWNERRPHTLRFSDGARCEFADPASLAALIGANVTPQPASQWEAAPRALLVVFAVILVVAVALYHYGVPFAARVVADRIPPALTASLADDTVATLDRSVFQPSSLTPSRQQQLTRAFDDLMRGPSDVRYSLKFRSSPAIGPNALALPSGTIVITDQLVALAKDDREILGVLGHEAGHVERRHTIRLVLQDSAVALLMGWAAGDFSSIAAAAPGTLMRAKYSRDFERDADAYAADVLLESSISPGCLADLLERLEQAAADRPSSSSAPLSGYLDSHPTTSERLAYLRERSR
jgi:Zn-dependent protease with chaperone function